MPRRRGGWASGPLRTDLLRGLRPTPPALSSALKDSSRRSINSDWKIELPGEFQIAGTTVRYVRRGLWEKISAKGPTKIPLHLMVRLGEGSLPGYCLPGFGWRAGAPGPLVAYLGPPPPTHTHSSEAAPRPHAAPWPRGAPGSQRRDSDRPRPLWPVSVKEGGLQGCIGRTWQVEHSEGSTSVPTRMPPGSLPRKRREHWLLWGPQAPQRVLGGRGFLGVWEGKQGSGA